MLVNLLKNQGGVHIVSESNDNQEVEIMLVKLLTITGQSNPTINNGAKNVAKGRPFSEQGVL